jgi:deaminated glutathione amidase
MSGSGHTGIQLCSGVDAATNRAAATPLIHAAANAGAQFIATPENSMRMDRDRARLLAASMPACNEPELQAWGTLAHELKVWLLLGSGSVAGEGKVFNRSYLFSPAGTVAAYYDKIHLFDVELGNGESYLESAGVHPGDRAVVAEGPLSAKIGLSICYDLRFASLYASLARAGAEIMVIPAAFTHTTG